jgi:hypothetical protein
MPLAYAFGESVRNDSGSGRIAVVTEARQTRAIRIGRPLLNSGFSQGLVSKDKTDRNAAPDRLYRPKTP